MKEGRRRCRGDQVKKKKKEKDKKKNGRNLYRQAWREKERRRTKKKGKKKKESCVFGLMIFWYNFLIFFKVTVCD